MNENLVLTRSFAECVEQLIIANIKLTWFDHAKQAELESESPDVNKIAQWELGSRAMNERRAQARQAIDLLLEQAIQTGKYTFLKDVRTFHA